MLPLGPDGHAEKDRRPMAWSLASISRCLWPAHCSLHTGYLPHGLSICSASLAQTQLMPISDPTSSDQIKQEEDITSPINHRLFTPPRNAPLNSISPGAARSATWWMKALLQCWVKHLHISDLYKLHTWCICSSISPVCAYAKTCIRIKPLVADCDYSHTLQNTKLSVCSYKAISDRHK